MHMCTFPLPGVQKLKLHPKKLTLSLPKSIWMWLEHDGRREFVNELFVGIEIRSNLWKLLQLYSNHEGLLPVASVQVSWGARVALGFTSPQADLPGWWGLQDKLYNYKHFVVRSTLVTNNCVPATTSTNAPQHLILFQTFVFFNFTFLF